MRRSVLIFMLGLCACPLSTAEPICLNDKDCGSGLCVHDLDRGDQYCSTVCADGQTCPPTMFCDSRQLGAPGDVTSVAVCLQRVRSCGNEEVCNGLDDDCDGLIDNACQQLSCVGERQCGGLWSCQANSSGSLTCAAPLANTAASGTRCQTETQCFNGLCEVGFCSPLCIDDEDCAVNTRCAKASTSELAVTHTSCHVACDAATPCPSGLACTLRSLPRECRFRAVCAPIIGTSTFGTSCTLDDECLSALCINGICTTPCLSSMECHGLTCTPVLRPADPLSCDVSRIDVCL